MKAILMVGFAIVLPALAQAPAEVLLRQLERSLADDAAHGLTASRVLTWSAGPGPGAIVKNAPYSADAVTETTQVLGDGNRIVQSTTQKLYRDSDGRERREESVLAMGALAQADAPRVITISDPVERISYSLDPQQRVARRTPGLGLMLGNGPVFYGRVGDVSASWSTFGTVLRTSDQRVAGIQAEAEPVKEDLGTRNVQGVMAKGTRSTLTIPAGQIGNVLPINVVDEVWFSPELQMNVLTTHNDPRSGESIYKLNNIARANPPKSLFEPPADYTVTGPGEGGRGGRGVVPNEPATGGGRSGGGRGPLQK